MEKQSSGALLTSASRVTVEKAPLTTSQKDLAFNTGVYPVRLHPAHFF